MRRAGLIDSVDVETPCTPSPTRILVERFDILELCCGKTAPLLSACSAHGLRCGPRIDFAVFRGWDLRDDRVVDWIFFLIKNRRVRYVHSGIPWTTFSIARFPRFRTRALPWGIDPSCPVTAQGNDLLRLILGVLFLCARVGIAASHEHPSSAFSWQISAWDTLLSFPHSKILKLSMCMYGEDYRKNTNLYFLNAPFLEPLHRPCSAVAGCSPSDWHDHTPLSGSATAAASCYPGDLCKLWASLLAAWIKDSGPDLPADVDSQLRGPSRRAVEKLYITDLMRSVPWKLMSQDCIQETEHINISELRILCESICLQARRHPHSRYMFLTDSLVALGAAAKGRSASPALNALLLKMLPYILGFDFYPGFDYTLTRYNRGDAPSRQAHITPPDRPIPHWMLAGGLGDFALLDRRRRLPKQSRSTANWAHLIWILREFDATLGYPGEGPRGRSTDALKRQGMSAQLQNRGHVPIVAGRRQDYIAYFSSWLTVFRDISFTDALVLLARQLDALLRDFGYHSCSVGRSRLSYSETINAVCDHDLHLRGRLPSAWDLSWAWRGLQDSGSHIPMPDDVFLAFLALCLDWDWTDVAACLALAFLGMLRPFEMLAVKPQDLSFLGSNPSQLLCLFLNQKCVRSVPDVSISESTTRSFSLSLSGLSSTFRPIVLSLTDPRWTSENASMPFADFSASLPRMARASRRPPCARAEQLSGTGRLTPRSGFASGGDGPTRACSKSTSRKLPLSLYILLCLTLTYSVYLTLAAVARLRLLPLPCRRRPPFRTR